MGIAEIALAWLMAFAAAFPGTVANAAVLASSEAPVEEPYAWPLDLPRIVTSSFGEYRAGRFHAGLDLRTGGIGIPVHAPADGYVAKVRCSPWGYGKAVYLRLNDGNQVVFGHLNDFMPDLAAFVRAEQHRNQCYTLEHEFRPSEFPVNKGQLVAFSGETGIGEAHLHYEIRDAQDQPISQRSLGITWPDETAPVVFNVLIMPKNPTSRINGDILPVIREVHLQNGPTDANAPGNRQYRCDPVHVSGHVGFGVAFVDPANNGDNKLGVHTVETRAGDQPVFMIRMERFSYADRENEIVAYHPFFKEKGCFLLQWRWPGNQCEIYNQCREDGWYGMPDHPVELTLILRDFFENEARVVIPLVPDTPSNAPVAFSSDMSPGSGSVEVQCMGEWLCVTAVFSAPEPMVPEILVQGGERPCTFLRVNDRTFRAGILPNATDEALTLRVAHERISPFEQRIEVFHCGDKARSFSTEGVRIRVMPTSPYGVLFMRLELKGKDVPTLLPARSVPFSLWPSDMPINTPVRLEIPVLHSGQNAAHMGVYRKSGEKWTYEGNEQEGDHFVLSTQQFGTYAILEDNQAPVISDITVGGDPAQTQRPSIHASITDAGSGIAEVTVTCDGKWLLCGYDPERACVDWERDADLPRNAATLVFVAKDKAGNATTASFELKKERAAKINRKSSSRNK